MDKGTYGFNVTNDPVVVTEPSIMAIDGSTTCSGIVIITLKGLLIYSMALERSNEETPVQYKVRFKQYIREILLRNSTISNVYYEEPFIGYVESAKILMSLRTSVEEIIAEEEPALSYLKCTEISNKVWKKKLLEPNPIPVGTKEEKEAVRLAVENRMSFMKSVTQDEIDATGLGLTVLWGISNHMEHSLESKKKVRPFKFNAEFIAAYTDNEMFDILGRSLDIWNVPEELVDTIEVVSLSGTGKFKNHVYEAIGNEDKLVIMKFKMGKFGNIYIEYDISNLIGEETYMYAVCWRKSRKKRR